MEVRAAHTSELEPATLRAARALLEVVFEGEMTEHDWEHSLGGMHVMAWEGEDLIGHVAVVQRRLLVGGRALRTGYVEGMGVRADRRRGGVGAVLMEAVERIIRGAYEFAALGSTDEAVDFYAACGWVRWEGPTAALTPNGIKRTPDDDGGIFVLPLADAVDVTTELVCDWRDGDVW